MPRKSTFLRPYTKECLPPLRVETENFSGSVSRQLWKIDLGISQVLSEKLRPTFQNYSDLLGRG